MKKSEKKFINEEEDAGESVYKSQISRKSHVDIGPPESISVMNETYVKFMNA